jgi:hypothetical protein
MNTWAKVLGVFAAAFVFVGVALQAAAPVPKGADGDPVLKDTLWKGKLTQKGGGPESYDCVFTITKRDGEKFEAELYEKTDTLELTYLVRGTVKPVDPKNKEKGFKIEFESYAAKDVKNTSEILNVPYTATLKGKQIKGSWKLPEDSPFGALEGDFEFELSKKE